MEADVHVTLSAQELVSCVGTDNTCLGGHPIDAYEWAKVHGVVPAKCIPYIDGKTKDENVSKCTDGSCSAEDEKKKDPPKYYASDYYSVVKPGSWEENAEAM